MQGLEGVVVAETRTSEVDGDAGELLLRGVPVAELAGRVPFEQVCRLMWEERLGEPGVDLGPARLAAFERLTELGRALDRPDAMDALRAAAAQLDGTSDAVAVTGALAVFAAAWARRAGGAAPIAPDPEAPHAADLLRMIRGEVPAPAEAAAMDAYLTTVVDHGMNASTFAARVVASTESDRVSAIVAGIGALKGRLHGGAPGPVLDMLDAIGTPERAEAWLRAALERGERVMGMGHRVYRVRDPRAAVLERAVEGLAAAGEGDLRRLALAREVERTAERLLRDRKPDRPLRANVELYTAMILEALRVPRALFTAVFACARAVGWNAHYDEQRATGRLIRPRARYVGPRPGPERAAG